MKLVLSRECKIDLLELDKLFKESLLPWWDDIYVYIRKLDEDITWTTLPLMVLDVYKYLGMERQISISMANIFRTLFFANHIHTLVKDDEEGQEYNRELQFSILIGDYIFGRMLKLLVEAGADKLVGLFAEMMAEINEGMIIEHKLGGGYQEVVRKTRAPLYARAFQSAALLASLGSSLENRYRQMGFNLGMAIELLSCNSLQSEVQAYIHEGEHLFVQLQEKEVKNSSLEKLIKELQVLVFSMDEFAAV